MSNKYKILEEVHVSWPPADLYDRPLGRLTTSSTEPPSASALRTKAQGAPVTVVVEGGTAMVTKVPEGEKVVGIHPDREFGMAVVMTRDQRGHLLQYRVQIPSSTSRSPFITMTWDEPQRGVLRDPRADKRAQEAKVAAEHPEWGEVSL